MTNPFAPHAPAEPAAQPGPAAGNPFGSPAPAAPTPQPYAPPSQPQQQPVAGYPAWHAYAQSAAPAQPQQQTAPAPLGFDMNRVAAAPTPVVGEGRGAKLMDMYGRLVVMFPLSIDNVPKNPQFVSPEDRAKGNLTHDRLTATVVVIDDGRGGQSPIEWGGNLYLPPGQQIPHTDKSPLPYVRKGMWINQSRLISQARPYLPGADGRPGVIVGRVLKAGPEQNAPWYLSTATPDEVTLAKQYLAAVEAGQVPHPLG